MADSPKKLEQDELVGALVPDPSQHQPTTQLSGWLGKGAAEGLWRLYLTPQMDAYVEFAEDDVVHTQPLARSDSPLGGTIVWVKSGVKLRHTVVVTRQVQADFLSGGVTSGFMAGTNPALFPQMQRFRAGRTNDFVCSTNIHIPACQIRTEVCPIGRTEITVCVIGSGDPNCEPGGTFGPSQPFICRTVGCTTNVEQGCGFP